MVQIGGWGNRSPFSRTEEISLAGIPSYGLDPKVINSQTVTPKRPERERMLKTHLLNKKARYSPGTKELADFVEEQPLESRDAINNVLAQSVDFKESFLLDCEQVTKE